ncbi:hypothetical protein ACP70R_022721 [Stipagrostis hirtigluma subsp. patula]
MGRRSGSKRKKARTSPGAGGDRITVLPLELRARIASLLDFRQVVQLSTLSRPWRHIHHHTPVVKLSLYGFISFTGEDSFPHLFDDDAILGMRVALGRRAEDAHGSKVDTLDLRYFVDCARLRRHADRIIALADARKVRVTIPSGGHAWQNAWTLDLPPAARKLEVVASGHLAPSIVGPAAAALRGLCLHCVVLSEWPSLPSLRSLSLTSVTVKAPFPPGDRWPLLENLFIFNAEIEQARVDIRLPHLKTLNMDGLDLIPHGDFDDGSPFGDVTVDAPELEELGVNCWTGGSCSDYRSFTLRAPRLRSLSWYSQPAGRVDIDVGTPGGVTAGTIEFSWIEEDACGGELKGYEAQMMRMLEGLLPELSPERVADAAKPHMRVGKYAVEDILTDEMIMEERLTCDLNAVMSSLEV